MKSKFSGVVAACGVAISVVMLATACTPPEGPTSSDLERVSAAIARGEGLVSVPALARRLVEDQGDFRVIDVRPAIEFDAGHIRGARNVSVTEIVRPATAREIAGTRQLVIYGQDAVAASQAAALLQLQGINAIALQGGFTAWNAWITDPTLELAGHEPVLSTEERRAITQLLHHDTAAQLEQTRAGRAAALGLAPATPTARPAAAPTVDDPHGLGLQYGLGVGISFELQVAEEAAAEEPAPRRRLLIGEGC